MVCRGTTVLIVMLALLTQTARSAEPSMSEKQRHTASQRERVRITVTGNSLKYVIRDPASRLLVGSKRPVRHVNHEIFDVTPGQQQILVSQFSEDRARGALDALRTVTDDLDLDLPKTVPATSPERPVTRPPQEILPPVEPPVESAGQADTAEPAPVLDASELEQRERQLRLLLESVIRAERNAVAPVPEPDLAREVDTETGVEENASTYRSDNRAVKPEPIYNQTSNYDEIPWTITGLFDDPDDFDRQCQEQEFCQRIWQCAGGRCLSPCDRWKRDVRRNYDQVFGACPSCNPMPLFSRLFVEPMLGYGFFGAPLGGVFGRAYRPGHHRCTSIGADCQGPCSASCNDSGRACCDQCQFGS